MDIGTEVTIHSGYSHKPVGQGKVVKVCKRWVEVATPMFARPVRFRTEGPLKGIRIIGGLAEQLNEYIEV